MHVWGWFETGKSGKFEATIKKRLDNNQHRFASTANIEISSFLSNIACLVIKLTIEIRENTNEWNE